MKAIQLTESTMLFKQQMKHNTTSGGTGPTAESTFPLLAVFSGTAPLSVIFFSNLSTFVTVKCFVFEPSGHFDPRPHNKFTPKLIFYWTVNIYVNINYILGPRRTGEPKLIEFSSDDPRARPCELDRKVRVQKGLCMECRTGLRVGEARWLRVEVES